MTRRHPAGAMALAALLLLGACGGSETPEAAAAALERFTSQMDRDEAAAKVRATAETEARAKVRADAGAERIGLERETLKRD